MNTAKPLSCRRDFLKATAAVATGLSELALLSNPAWSSDAGVNIIGPKPGYSPQVGTLVSMLTWMGADLDGYGGAHVGEGNVAGGPRYFV